MDFWTLYLSDLGPWGLLATICAVILALMGNLSAQFKGLRWLLTAPIFMLPMLFLILTVVDMPTDHKGVVVETNIENSILSPDYVLYFQEEDKTLKVMVSMEEYFKLPVGESGEFWVRKYHKGSAKPIPHTPGEAGAEGK